MWERCPVTELNDAGFCSSFNLACVRSPTSWSEIQIQHDGLHVSPGRATFLLSLSVSASRFFFFLLFPIPAFHSLFISPGLSLFQMKPNVNLIRKKPNIYGGGDLKRGLIVKFQRFFHKNVVKEGKVGNIMPLTCGGFMSLVPAGIHRN